MIFVVLLLFLWSPFMYGSDDTYYEFMRLKDQYMHCSLDCANPACASIPAEITWYQDKEMYKKLHGAFHEKKILPKVDPTCICFINRFGHILIGDKNAKTNNELVLFQEKKSYLYNPKKVEARLREIFEERSKEDPANIKPLSFDIISSTDEKEDPKVFEELCYCAPDYFPTEVLELLYQKIIGTVKNQQYVYYFLETNKVNEQDPKQFLFGIENLTKFIRLFKKYQNEKNRDGETVQDCISKDHYLEWKSNRHFLTYNSFKIKELYAELDFYGNKGNRLVMLGECEEKQKTLFSWFFSDTQKRTILMHVPKEWNHITCRNCRGTYSFEVKKYTVEDLNAAHARMLKSEWEGTPFCCYHAHSITGSLKDLKGYLNSALARIRLRKSCYHKNDAASSNLCTVYTNPFNQLLIQCKNGSFIELQGFLPHFNTFAHSEYSYIGLPIYDNNAVCDKQKMEQLARRYATQWERSSDGTLMYWCDERENGLFAEVWPFGKQHGWELFSLLPTPCRGSTMKFEGHQSFYAATSSEAEKHVRNEFASFSRYRLWIVPLINFNKNSQHFGESIFLRYENSGERYGDNELQYNLIYTDWPYKIIDIQDQSSYGDIRKRLTLSHVQSDYTLYLYYPFPGEKYSVIFCDQKSFDEKNGTCLPGTLVYVYKNEQKWQAFLKQKNEYERVKEREKEQRREAQELAKNKAMGLSLSAQSTSSGVSSSNQKQKTSVVPLNDNNPKYPFLATVYRYAPICFALGIIFGGVTGLLSALYEQRTVDTKLPAPTT